MVCCGQYENSTVLKSRDLRPSVPQKRLEQTRPRTQKLTTSHQPSEKFTAAEKLRVLASSASATELDTTTSSIVLRIGEAGMGCEARRRKPHVSYAVEI